MIDSILQFLGSPEALLVAPFFLLVGNMNWRIPGQQYHSGNDIYNYSFNNPTGLNPNSNWTPADLAGLESIEWQRPDTSQQNHPGSIQNYLNNEATMREVFGLFGNGNGGVGGGPGMWGSGGAQGTGSSQGFSLGLGNTSLGGGAAGAAGAGGAGAGGAAMAGSGAWWSNPQLWGAVLGAGSSYLDQRQQNQNAQQANRPQPYSNQTTPWGPAASNLEFGLQEALRRYQNQPQGPGGGRGRGGGGGGGGIPSGPNPNLNPQMQGLLDSMVARGGSIPGYIQDAQSTISGMTQGGGSNPYLSGTYDQASGYQNPYYDQFITSMFSDSLPGVPSGGTRNNPYGTSGHYGRGSSGGGGGGGQPRYEPNEWLRASLEGEWLNEGNEEMDALLETMANETREQYLRELAPAVDAEYIRAGRYGSDAYSRAQGYAAEEFGEALAGQQAQTRYANYNDERQRMQDSLGLMTQGELGMMGLAGQREQAAASRASSAASAGASRYATDAQLQLGNRGLLLDAIRGVSDDDMNRMGLMGQMAGLFGEERLGALNAIPGIEEASWMGAGNAWGAGMDATNRSDQIQMRNQQMAAQRRAQQEANATRRWQMGQQMDQQRFDDLMRWSMATGETFGQTSGVSSPNQFIPQGNNWAAALQGGMGGYMFGSGMNNRQG